LALPSLLPCTHPRLIRTDAHCQPTRYLRVPEFHRPEEDPCRGAEL
jgi:hypothetical protein